MQTLNVSYADHARHVQIYLSLLASRGVEIQICLFLMLGVLFLPKAQQHTKLKYAGADVGSNA